MKRYRCSDGCSHPHLNEPIASTQFEREFKDLYRRTGLTGGYSLELTEELAERHLGDSRAYAQVEPVERRFEFAPQVLELPSRNRMALALHEMGHVLDPAGTESGADKAVYQATGFIIFYDPRWPGKGMQYLATDA